MSTTAMMRGSLAVTCLLATLAVTIALITGAGSPAHVVYAEFADAGQLVRGDLVTVAGHQVGRVGSLSLTRAGLASVPLEIDDDSVWPLHQGTRAQIGELSLPSVANRYVSLSLSASGPQIPQHGTLGVQYTKGIVDLDVLFDTLTPKVRRALKSVIDSGARVFSPRAAAQLNSGLHYLNPAIDQLTGMAGEVVSDRYALDRLVANTSVVTQALAMRSLDLDNALRTSARWLGEAGSQRAALRDAVARAPAVLRQSVGVLADVSYTLRAADPVLRAARPVARPLSSLVRAGSDAVHGAVPLAQTAGAIVGPATRAFALLPSVSRVAVPAMQSLDRAIGPVIPLLSAFRPYVPDAVAAFFQSFGSAGGYYDANGNYARGSPILTGSSHDLSGLYSLLGASGPASGLTGGRMNVNAPCPGGGESPVPGGSNPWTSLDTLPAVGVLCDPADDNR